MDRKKIDLAVAAIVSAYLFAHASDSKEIEVPPPKAVLSTTHDLPARVRVPVQTVAQCYCWIDASGNMTWGQLKNVPMECFQGFDKIKGWSHGLIQKPVVGR